MLVASQLGRCRCYIIGFVMLFIFSGIGNGSTYKMIPTIFHAKAQLDVGAGEDVVAADLRAIRRSGALIGLAGAIGALGGVVVNLAFRQSFLTLKNGDGAVHRLHRLLRDLLRGHLGGVHPAPRGPARRSRGSSAPRRPSVRGWRGGRRGIAPGRCLAIIEVTAWSGLAAAAHVVLYRRSEPCSWPPTRHIFGTVDGVSLQM